MLSYLATTKKHLYLLGKYPPPKSIFHLLEAYATTKKSDTFSFPFPFCFQFHFQMVLIFSFFFAFRFNFIMIRVWWWIQMGLVFIEREVLYFWFQVWFEDKLLHQFPTLVQSKSGFKSVEQLQDLNIFSVIQDLKYPRDNDQIQI